MTDTIKGWPILEHIPTEWHIVEGATTTPNGYILIASNHSIFNPKRKSGLIKIELK